MAEKPIYAQVALSTGEEMKGLHEGGDQEKCWHRVRTQAGKKAAVRRGPGKKEHIRTMPWMGEHGRRVKDLQGRKRWVCPCKGAERLKQDIRTPAGM